MQNALYFNITVLRSNEFVVFFEQNCVSSCGLFICAYDKSCMPAEDFFFLDACMFWCESCFFRGLLS